VVVDNLARGLAERGHDVRLFTIGESRCPVPCGWLYRSARHPMGTSVEEAAHVLAAYDALEDVDVIHDHTVLGPLVGVRAGRAHPPVVCTHHGAFTADNRRIFTEIARRAAVVAISHDQRSRAGTVAVTAVVHHGIDLAAYRAGPGGEYLLFLGRMSPDKGVHVAVRAAHAAGRSLKLAVKMREPAERSYFAKEVRPLLGPDDEVVVEPPHADQVQLLRHAAALINPISWPEPFGLVMAEALACGTPVIAFAHGAAPEIVEDGRTGFLGRDEDDLIRAVARVPELERASCRAAAEKHFSLQRMAADHETLYRREIQAHGAIRPLVPMGARRARYAAVDLRG
jgi:glycosyltransferase involved in cell wall biosynthesis